MSEAWHALLNGERNGLKASLQRTGLWALSWPYRLAIWGRNFCFNRGWKRTLAVPVPVISVGNLTVGGTGKTPTVEYVARFFREGEWRVGILSRGYGSQHGLNDEALVLEQNLPDVPHLQGADRVLLAQTAVEELESEILILDDGFQHRRLKRDLDIVLIDATNPWGHGYLLPRGLLREPAKNLRRAHLVLLTRTDQAPPRDIEAIVERVRKIAPNLPIATTAHRPKEWINSQRLTQPVESLQGRPLAGFCGLGNPAGFRRSLENLGLPLLAWRTFPDHHPYTRADVDDLNRWAEQLPQDAAVVTTQKDLVKLQIERLAGRELWALRIELHVNDGEDRVRELLASMMPLAA